MEKILKDLCDLSLFPLDAMENNHFYYLKDKNYVTSTLYSLKMEAFARFQRGEMTKNVINYLYWKCANYVSLSVICFLFFNFQSALVTSFLLRFLILIWIRSK